VFVAGWPITAVGLDVTMKTMLSEERLATLAACGTPAARHISLISQYYLERYAARRGRRECSMHDALALAIAADRSLVTHAPLARVDIELTGTHTRGMTVADLRSSAPTEQANAHVVLEVDSERFIERWLDVLCQRIA
jgi:inosine/uridine nucleosidase